MAIAFDSAVDGGRTSNAGSKSFAFNNVAGNTVVVYARNTNGASPSSVLYAGVACSFVGMYDNGGDHRHNMFVKTSPATGSNNVIIGYAAQQGFIDAGAVSYSGAHTTLPIGAVNILNQINGVANFGGSVLTTADNSWVIACIGNSTGDASAGAGSAERWSNANGNGFYDSNGVIATPTLGSVLATRPGASNWTTVFAELKSPAAAVVAAVNKNLLLMGVGA